MHPRLEANVRRSLALGVCHSMETTTPKFRKPRRKVHGLVESIGVALGWFVIAVVFALALVAAR